MAASALLLVGALASSTAMADYRGHGHGRGGNVHFGLSIGVPIFGPRYYPAPYYGYPAYAYPAAPYYGYPAAPVYAYPPEVIQPSAPPVYVEQGATAAAPAPAPAQNDWYYCAESSAYYPYVAQCPAGWQRVPAQPSR